MRQALCVLAVALAFVVCTSAVDLEAGELSAVDAGLETQALESNTAEIAPRKLKSKLRKYAAMAAKAIQKPALKKNAKAVKKMAKLRRAQASAKMKQLKAKSKAAKLALKTKQMQKKRVKIMQKASKIRRKTNKMLSLARKASSAGKSARKNMQRRQKHAAARSVRKQIRNYDKWKVKKWVQEGKALAKLHKMAAAYRKSTTLERAKWKGLQSKIKARKSKIKVMAANEIGHKKIAARVKEQRVKIKRKLVVQKNKLKAAKAKELRTKQLKNQRKKDANTPAVKSAKKMLKKVQSELKSHKKSIKKAHKIAERAITAQKKTLVQKDKVKSQKVPKAKTQKKAGGKKPDHRRGCEKAGVSCKMYDALVKKCGGVVKLKKKLKAVMRFDKAMKKAKGKKVKGRTVNKDVGRVAFYKLARQYGLIKGKAAKKAPKLKMPKVLKTKKKKAKKHLGPPSGAKPNDKKGGTWPGLKKKVKPTKAKVDKYIDKQNRKKGLLARSMLKKKGKGV